ncbi:MAG: hypothetical protein H6545_00090 [Bacteroidales bacterium]|nr:hypothetical protein [Bacteroidales bacterium]
MTVPRPSTVSPPRPLMENAERGRRVSSGRLGLEVEFLEELNTTSGQLWGDETLVKIGDRHMLPR